ncbi:hypothetical protein [Ornithinimicrobium avium]|uniref:Uncharacterized protein n=1 Tax=Ornithinimicrobium avium TaxID=2283195 RepID=A0A345NMY8_9MICO|nr:hypothetical protein [Ornithinimicrobium avium]AXH96396.1 hypothetical protein DV701_09935 [Ornithinimicrobium avium]
MTGNMVDPATGVPPADRPPGTGAAHLVPLAVEGLQRMWRQEHEAFAQTVRLVPGPTGPWLRPEGHNPRYTAIVALGASRLPEEQQRQALRGRRAADLVEELVDRAPAEDGAAALTAWAAGEVLGTVPEPLLGRLAALVEERAVDTVVLAWALTASTTPTQHGSDGRLAGLRRAARRRLLEARGEGGTFPHRIPADSQPRLRRHVGSFADQIYPVQALTRVAMLDEDDAALAAAVGTADHLVALQGRHGEWWWHYHHPHGGVVERFPVYSVHQHGMAPMALTELGALTSRRYDAAVERGVGWLRTHPQTVVELVDPRHAMIWRKVGRREPGKLVRGLAATATTAGVTLPTEHVDRAFPAGVVDHECRPYELGWLLYAWAGLPDQPPAGGAP